PKHSVAWVAHDGAEALTRCARDTPDIILMDLLMPTMDGAEATRRIMAQSPCAILVVTATVEGNASKVFEAMGAGALDAVQTPALGRNNSHEGAKALLAKIEMIGKLVGERQGKATHDIGGDTILLPRTGRLVAIGSSAGGPAALATVLEALPK